MNQQLINAFYCQNCGEIDYPVKQHKGTIAIEAGLLLISGLIALLNIIFGALMFLVFVIYCLWRLSSKQKVCASCKSEYIIPANSPMVQKMLREYDT